MKMLRGLGLLALLALGAGGYAIYRIEQPYQGFQGDVFVDVARGTGTGSIADALVRAGVVPSRWDFLMARTINREGVLQAGEYRFTRAASPAEIVSRIRRGDVFYYELVVPEGKNMFDIAALIDELGVFRGADFLKAARNPEIIHDLDPKAPTLEGYLFPDTYQLTR